MEHLKKYKIFETNIIPKEKIDDLIILLYSELFDEYNIVENNNYNIRDGINYWDYILDNDSNISGVGITIIKTEDYINISNNVYSLGSLIYKRIGITLSYDTEPYTSGVVFKILIDR